MVGVVSYKVYWMEGWVWDLGGWSLGIGRYNSSVKRLSDCGYGKRRRWW